jgi:hypothetical protein
MAESTMPWPDEAATMAQPLAPLEGRVQRLESAVAALQDTQALEDRVAERVAARLESTVNSKVQTMAATDQRVSGAAMMAAAGDALRAVATPVGQSVAQMPWLIVDLYQEVVAIARMFFDLHYKVGWSTRLLVLVLVPAILTSHWWLPFSHVVVIGELFDKVVDLILAFVVVKALSREARRYMQFRATHGRW